MKTKETSLLKVTANVPAAKPDINGKKYNRVSVEALPKHCVDPVTGEVFEQLDMKARGGSFNQYEDSYLNEGHPDLAYNAKIGTRIEGKVVQRKVEEYSFQDKEDETVTTDKYTTIVFGNTADEALFEDEVKRVFENADKVLIEQEEKTAPIQALDIALAPEAIELDD